MRTHYQHIRTLFNDGNYIAVVTYYLDITKDHQWPDYWEQAYSIFYCALADAYMKDYRNAIEDFKEYIQRCRSLFYASGAIQECSPVFITRLSLGQPEQWYELWHQMRHEKAPMEALIEELWNPDLDPYDHTSRQPIYEALKMYGQAALPTLLTALRRNDRNYEGIVEETVYPKIALVNIGDAAFDALVTAIETPGSGRLARAAIKMLRMFGDDRAESVLRKALDARVNYENYIIEELEGIEQATHNNSPAWP